MTAHGFDPYRPLAHDLSADPLNAPTTNGRTPPGPANHARPPHDPTSAEPRGPYPGEARVGRQVTRNLATATAAVAPVVGGAALYGHELQAEITSLAEQTRNELAAAVEAQRAAMREEHESYLVQIQAAGEAAREQVAEAGEQLRETARAMMERIEGATFEVRDEINRMSARLRGESDERLDVLEDHLRSALERARVEVEDATQQAMARVRAAVESEVMLHRNTLPVETPPAEPAFYLSPEQADEDDVDLG